MTQKCKCGKKLVLLKTLYFRNKTQDGLENVNSTNFITNPPTASRSAIRHMTDKNFNSIKNAFIEFNTIIIPPNNPDSGITEQTFQQTIMIKTKCGFVSANTFFFDNNSDVTTTALINIFPVTAPSGDLKKCCSSNY